MYSTFYIILHIKSIISTTQSEKKESSNNTAWHIKNNSSIGFIYNTMWILCVRFHAQQNIRYISIYNIKMPLSTGSLSKWRYRRSMYKETNTIQCIYLNGAENLLLLLYVALHIFK